MDEDFRLMGLDDRLLKEVARLGWNKPTLIQAKAIPLVLKGQDLLMRARTGSGKTGAFALPMLHKILTIKSSLGEQALLGVVLAPSKELCHQIAACFKDLASSCSRDLKVLDVSQIDVKAGKTLLKDVPDIMVATPARALIHFMEDNVDYRNIKMLVVDEADLIFSFGYEDDFRKFVGYIPANVQSILASATLSDDVAALKTLALHNPVILKLEEPLIPSTCQLTHYVIRAEEEDKFVLLYALLKLNLVRGKSLVFVNTVDRSYKLKLYLEQFGIKACVLNSELPQMSRWHTVQQFNLGMYNIIIASDDRHLDEKQAEEVTSEGSSSKPRLMKKDKESGVARGIDFQFVSNVINFDFPLDSSSYLHRVGRTARGNNQGAALSFVSTAEQKLVQEVESVLTELGGAAEIKMQPFNFRMDEVEGFRYRSKDALKAVTRIAIREARLREIRVEIMNSKKLQTYFQDNPSELKALRHDKTLRTVKQQPHLRNVPEYIVPKTLKQVSRVSRYNKSARNQNPDAQVNDSTKRKGHSRRSQESRKRNRDPLLSMQFGGFKKKNKK